MKTQPHIPTLIALFILLVGLGGGIFLVEYGTSFFSHSRESATPKEVTISNVTDIGFTVSWITDMDTNTLIRYNGNGLFTAQNSLVDDRDGEIPEKRFVHSVSISQLNPETTYTFEIVSDGLTYKNDRYKVATGPILGSPTYTLEPAFGTISNEFHERLDSGIVYASFEGSQILSSLVDNGAWVIPLGRLRANDLSRYFIPNNDTEERLFFVHQKGKTLARTTIENDSPLPPVRIGELYDFLPRETSDRGLIIAQTKTSAQTSDAVNIDFQITAPKKDAAIPSYKPGFKGIGIAGKSVVLTISGNKSIPQTGKVTVDTNGNWSWTPANNLAAGNYSISAASFAKNNQPLVISQAFTILKSGTQVLQAATPSASIKPSPSPTASLAATPKASPRVSPSPVASASATPVPVTGNWEPTLVFLLAGAALFIFGLLTPDKKINR